MLVVLFPSYPLVIVFSHILVVMRMTVEGSQPGVLQQSAKVNGIHLF